MTHPVNGYCHHSGLEWDCLSCVENALYRCNDENLRLRDALEDLWGACEGSSGLQPQTIEACRENHERLTHDAQGDQQPR